jgi:hypothetical protein
MAYKPADYYVDFSSRDNISDTDKIALQRIQDQYFPMERVTFLVNYRLLGVITDDDYEKMTGIPYTYDCGTSGLGT